MRALFKFILTTSLLTSLIAVSAPIKNIEILGLNAVSRGTVLSYLPVETGDEYNEQISKKIIHNLEKTQFFKDIEVSELNQTLKIKVVENPQIKYIDLKHSEEVFEEEDIAQVLPSMGLTRGKIFNKTQLDKLIAQIKATYIGKGYYSVEVNEKIEIDDSHNKVGIELDIVAGEVARIKSMSITGNKTQEDQDLLGLFDIGEPDFFIINYFTEKDYYSKVVLDAGIEALKSYYLNLGYFDFRIIDVKSDLSEDKQSINIAIQIDEGNQYTVGKIEFSGDMLNESSESLAKLLAINEGDVFERKKIVKSIRDITIIYTNQGYAFTKVDILTSENKDAHIVDLEFKVSPHKKVYINRITITGNTRTKDEVVRREIGVYEGGLYSDEELAESVTKIKRLGFFSDVKMNISRVEDFDDKIDINFSVKETQTGSFSIGVSHSNETNTSLNLSVSERNFLGTGNTLHISTTNSRAVKDIRLFFSDPYFTKDKHSISYGVFNKKTDGSELEHSAYQLDSKGGSIGYSIPITKDTRIGTNLEVSSRELICGRGYKGYYVSLPPGKFRDVDTFDEQGGLYQLDYPNGSHKTIYKDNSGQYYIENDGGEYAVFNDKNVYDIVPSSGGTGKYNLEPDPDTEGMYQLVESKDDVTDEYNGNYNIESGGYNFVKVEDVEGKEKGYYVPRVYSDDDDKKIYSSDGTDITNDATRVWNGEYSLFKIDEEYVFIKTEESNARYNIDATGSVINVTSKEKIFLRGNENLGYNPVAEDEYLLEKLKDNNSVDYVTDKDNKYPGNGYYSTFKVKGLEESQCTSGDKKEVKLGVNWSNNTLDDYNFPTKGNVNSIGVEVALPIADFKYYKLDAAHKSYHSFAKDLTLKTHVKVGLAQGYNGKELPFFERYYGGGSSSIRGFEFNSIGPKYANGNTKGGGFSLLTGISVISPLTFLKDSENMRMSTFIDAGGISEKISSFENDDFRSSVGVAFAWLTPIGPLGAYAAHPIVKKTGDKTNTFELTVGTKF